MPQNSYEEQLLNSDEHDEKAMIKNESFWQDDEQYKTDDDIVFDETIFKSELEGQNDYNQSRDESEYSYEESSINNTEIHNNDDPLVISPTNIKEEEDPKTKAAIRKRLERLFI